MFRIIRREDMADGIVVLNEIEAHFIAKNAKPGQFVILRASETGERIPLTMADTDPEKGTITIAYMVVGKTTASFAALNVGDSYLDITGPLGKPTHIEKVGTVVCVGGGTGAAVLHPIAKAMKAAGNEVIAVLGARNQNMLIMTKEMRAASNELLITTDDGSYGHHGFVTDVLKDLMETREINQVVAIGPVPMMKFLSILTKKYNVPTLVSLNPIMVDGTGMCGCCRVSVNGETKFACVDGPEFDGHQVDFDELTKRLSAYREDEQMSYSEYCLRDSNDN